MVVIHFAKPKWDTVGESGYAVARKRGDLPVGGDVSVCIWHDGESTY